MGSNKLIYYSDKYVDATYEYRHVILPKAIFEKIPKGRLLRESEWRSIGVGQGTGWKHYMLHNPEPHILLFRRPLRQKSVESVPKPAAVPPVPKPTPKKNTEKRKYVSNPRSKGIKRYAP